MRSAANGHNGSGSSNLNGPGPLMLVIGGVALNPVPPRWAGMAVDFGPW